MANENLSGLSAGERSVEQSPSNEVRAFLRHASVFEEEEDCHCVLDDIRKYLLIDNSVLCAIVRTEDKKAKNRSLIGKIADVVNTDNFNTFYSIFASRPCYANFISSVQQYLLVFQSLNNTIFESEFKFNNLLTLLYKEQFLSEEQCKLIRSQEDYKGKQTFIALLEVKPVEYIIKHFVECLDKNNLLSEFKLANRLVSTPRKSSEFRATNYEQSLSASLSLLTSGSSSPRQLYLELPAQNQSVFNEFQLYLINRYKRLPNTSKQAWYDDDGNEDFFDVTIQKFIRKNIPYSASTKAIKGPVNEYITQDCKSYDEIFQLEPDISNLILIEGESGSGKTTFSYKMCKDWASGKGLKQFSHVILIPLRDQKGKEVTPIELFCKSSGIADVSNIRFQMTNKWHVLIWLEGWDELDDDFKDNSLFTELLHGDMFPQAAVVVSTRPFATASLKRYIFGNKYKLVGFDTKQVNKYISGYFSHLDVDARKHSFVYQLHKIRGLASLAIVPLNLSILLKVFFHYSKMPDSFTGIYYDYLLIRLQYHKERCSSDKAPIQDIDEIPQEMLKILHRLEKHAFNYISEENFAKQVVLYDIFESTDDRDFDAFGLFEVIEVSTKTGKLSCFRYRYKIIQEFLAALYLSRLESHQSKALAEIFGDCKYEMVWIFYAGITKLEAVQLESVLPKVSARSQNVMKLPAIAHTELVNYWQQCHSFYLRMSGSTKHFLLILILCCYEAENSNACKVIADYHYPNNICRIEIATEHIDAHSLLAISYFILHSGKQWSLRCVSTIPSGVELLSTYISDPNLNSKKTGGLWAWCSSVQSTDIDAYIRTIQSQRFLHTFPGSCLGDDGTSKLCECLKFNNQLLKMELEDSAIGNIGLQSIASMLLFNSKIIFIDVRKNSFTIEAMNIFLLTIKHRPYLECLLVDRRYAENPEVIANLQQINSIRKAAANVILKVTDT